MCKCIIYSKHKAALCVCYNPLENFQFSELTITKPLEHFNTKPRTYSISLPYTQSLCCYILYYKNKDTPRNQMNTMWKVDKPRECVAMDEMTANKKKALKCKESAIETGNLNATRWSQYSLLVLVKIVWKFYHLVLIKYIKP